MPKLKQTLTIEVTDKKSFCPFTMEHLQYTQPCERRQDPPAVYTLVVVEYSKQRKDSPPLLNLAEHPGAHSGDGGGSGLPNSRSERQ